VPTWGLKDQVTAVFEVPLTLAVKVALCPPLRDVRLGETLTLTTLAFPLGASAGLVEFPTRETAALLAGSVVLAAVNVAVCSDCAEVEAGSTKIMANMAAIDMNGRFIVIRFDRFAIYAYRAVGKKQ
jgi:hypothetical protein